VHQQYAETVRPMADQFIAPTKSFADLILSGTRPLEQSVQAVLDHVRKMESSRSV